MEDRLGIEDAPVTTGLSESAGDAAWAAETQLNQNCSGSDHNSDWSDYVSGSELDDEIPLKGPCYSDIDD